MADIDINWQRVCLNLRRYKNLATVARELGIDADHLNNLARGDVRQPRWETGIKLLDLHYEQFPEKHTKEELCSMH